MYLRFVTTRIDESSHRPKGILTTAYQLLNSGALNSVDWARLRQTLEWFNDNLDGPPEKFASSRVIDWYRSSADAHIDRMWEIVYLLREHGYHIEVHKCRRLANICYDDKVQVAAYPSNDDGRITIQ